MSSRTRSPSSSGGAAAGAGGGRAKSPSRFSKFTTRVRSIFGPTKEQKAVQKAKEEAFAAEYAAKNDFRDGEYYKIISSKNNLPYFARKHHKLYLDASRIVLRDFKTTAEEALAEAVLQQSEEDTKKLESEEREIEKYQALTPEQQQQQKAEYDRGMAQYYYNSRMAVPKRRISGSKNAKKKPGMKPKSRSQYAKKKPVAKRRKVTKRKSRSQYAKKSKK